MSNCEDFNFADQNQRHINDHTEKHEPPLVDNDSARGLGAWIFGSSRTRSRYAGDYATFSANLRSNEIDVGADETKLRSSEGDVNANATNFAVTFETYLRKGHRFGLLTDFKEQFCAV